MAVIDVEGTCPTCDRATRFVAEGPWLRDELLCTSCGSLPRERALMSTIEAWFPAWRTLTIHESSPAPRGASEKLRRECPGYSASHWFPGAVRGAMDKATGFRNEDLESLTLADESVDLFVSQDVLEHILDPGRAFAEIARVLRPGGAHVFSVPLVSKASPSVVAAERDPLGRVVHRLPPTYHGNPIDGSGSLVTRNWGYDITEFVHAHAGLTTTIVYIDDLSRGIRAEYIEILVSRKPLRAAPEERRLPRRALELARSGVASLGRRVLARASRGR